MMASALDTVNENVPSVPVAVPLVVPFSMTEAPTIGPKSSRTEPFTSNLFCANEVKDIAQPSAMQARIVDSLHIAFYC